MLPPPPPPPVFSRAAGRPLTSIPRPPPGAEGSAPLSAEFGRAPGGGKPHKPIGGSEGGPLPFSQQSRVEFSPDPPLFTSTICGVGGRWSLCPSWKVVEEVGGALPGCGSGCSGPPLPLNMTVLGGVRLSLSTAWG